MCLLGEVYHVQAHGTPPHSVAFLKPVTDGTVAPSAASAFSSAGSFHCFFPILMVLPTSVRSFAASLPATAAVSVSAAVPAWASG